MALCSVSSLLEDFGAVVWRADALARPASADAAALPSGHAELDARLPGGGWPTGALCEILQTTDAQCEWHIELNERHITPLSRNRTGLQWLHKPRHTLS